MAFTFRQVAGTYPGAGPGSRVMFALSQAMNDGAGTQIEAITRTMYLDELTGAGTISLPANDDASTVPAGTYYLVTERITGAPERSYAVTILHAATEPIQLATLPHASTGTVTYGITDVVSADASVIVTTPAPGIRNLQVIGGGGGGSAHIIEDEGTPLTARAKLNFLGAGVTATDNAGANSTDVTIPSGGPPTGAAGGDLAGTYPNPTLANTSTARDNLGLGLVATLLGAVARSIIRKAGTLVGTRRAINFIEGTNITLTVADNAGTEAVDVTITAAGGGGGMTNPMTTEGDQIVGGVAGAPGRVAVGAVDRVWKSNGTDPVWADQATIKSSTGQMSLYTTTGEAVRISDSTFSVAFDGNHAALGVLGRGVPLVDLYSEVLDASNGSLTLKASRVVGATVTIQPHQAVFILNSVAVPTTNPVGGGYLYVESGALKFRGSSGTITTLGPA